MKGQGQAGGKGAAAQCGGASWSGCGAGHFAYTILGLFTTGGSSAVGGISNLILKNLENCRDKG